jgi:hypothetical protein
MSCLVRNHKGWNYNILTARFCMFMVLSLLIPSLVSCNKCNESKNVASGSAAQKTFASPAEAGTAFFEAAKSGNQAELLAIFGPEAKDILFSGDPVKDRNALQDFVAAYLQMNRWRQIKAGGEILYTGADNYPFPIPLDKNSSGQWYFDTAAGKDEILARRIGKGELTAIAACSAIADAEHQYFGQSHDGEKIKQYAQKIVSDESKQNGLYWPSEGDQPPSPLGQVGDFAKAVGYTGAGQAPQPFNGYFYRILDKQGGKAPGGAKDYIVNGKMTGGFAILAYPAEYRNSGIMTFVVGVDGVIYQKDLGEKTTDAAAAMTEYDPDGWEKVVGTETLEQ